MNALLQGPKLVLLQGQEFGTGGLIQWIENNVITLVILILAVCVFWAVRKGELAKGVTILAGAVLGMVMLGLATGTTATDVGTFVTGLFTS